MPNVTESNVAAAFEAEQAAIRAKPHHVVNGIAVLLTDEELAEFTAREAAWWAAELDRARDAAVREARAAALTALVDATAADTLAAIAAAPDMQTLDAVQASISRPAVS